MFGPVHVFRDSFQEKFKMTLFNWLTDPENHPTEPKITALFLYRLSYDSSIASILLVVLWIQISISNGFRDI